MGAFFPPGDTRSDHVDREPCLWREMSLALHLISQAVNPMLSLHRCLARWNHIAADLAEPHRRRNLQLNGLADFIDI
jgi:hypothetical protein